MLTKVEAVVGSICTKLDLYVDGEKKEEVTVRTPVWRAIREIIKYQVPVQEV